MPATRDDPASYVVHRADGQIKEYPVPLSIIDHAHDDFWRKDVTPWLIGLHTGEES